ncbi:hypothetical protein AVEN_31410-1 [Araneus ventricosus]|uniref:Uncharacterized protein n=1 Tax=Araneus ventricosus TaxID=182803 RepID=A0A4Y2EY17_ARAVE|nr:hypothetical protein AVEN_31410-1 [Araneus ventricosus]
MSKQFYVLSFLRGKLSSHLDDGGLVSKFRLPLFCGVRDSNQSKIRRASGSGELKSNGIKYSPYCQVGKFREGTPVQVSSSFDDGSKLRGVSQNSADIILFRNGT